MDNPRAEETRLYPSAVDIWIVSILVGVPLLVAGLGVLAWQKSPVAACIQIGLGLGIGVLIFLFARPCHYLLGAKTLEITCGLWKESIPLRQIHQVKLSCSLLSAPALSIRRISLLLKNGEQRQISPVDREAFMQDLSRRLNDGGNA